MYLQHRFFVGLLVTAVLSTAPSGAQPAPQGDDFQVNAPDTSTDHDFKSPSVAVLPGEGFVVVWNYENNSYGGYYNYVNARRFDPDGQPVGGEFGVSSLEEHYHLYPTVSGAEDGSFLVVWESYSETRARHFDSAGLPTDDAFALTSDRFGKPRVDGSNQFVVVWSEFGDGSSDAIWARLVDSAGVPSGSQFQVNTYTTSAQNSPDVAVAADGSFAVAWENNLPDAGGRARWFDSAGQPLTAEQLLEPSAPDVYTQIRTAHHGNRFLVVWDEDGYDGDAAGIRARFWDSSGQPVGAAFQVNTNTVGAQIRPTAAATGDGTFVVVWSESAGQTGQLLSSTGALLGGEFAVSSNTGSSQSSQALDAGFASLVSVWRNNEPDEDFVTIDGRRFEQPAIFSDGFESGDTTAWSNVVSP